MTRQRPPLVQDAYRSPEWIYERGTGRYRNLKTGRFLSRNAVLGLVQGRINSLSSDIFQSGDDLITGRLTLNDWQRNVAEDLKKLWIQQFALGKGGVDRVTPEEWLSMGRVLKAQYAYLRRFAGDIATGRISEAQLQARLRLYVQASSFGFWAGQDAAERQKGKQFMRRILGVAEHCPDCLRYAEQGIQPIGSLPLPTVGCVCRANCRCSVRYYTAEEAQKLMQPSLAGAVS